VVALALLTSSCSGGESPVVRAPVADTGSVVVTPSIPADSVSLAVAESISTLQVLYDRLVALGGDRTAVRARWNEPRVTTVDVVQNVHDPSAMDSVVRWTYGDAQFAFLVAMGRDLLVQTRVPPDHAAISSLVTELMAPEAVESLLGPPTWRDTAADTIVFTYKVTQGGMGEVGNALQFYFRRGRLRAIAAVPYVD